MIRSSCRPKIHVFIILFLIPLIASVWTVAERHAIEKARRNVAVFVDLRDLLILQRLAGANIAAAHVAADTASNDTGAALEQDRLLAELRRLGVTGIVVPVSVPCEGLWLSGSADLTATDFIVTDPASSAEIQSWLAVAQQAGFALVPLVLIPDALDDADLLSQVLRIVSGAWHSPFALFADGNGAFPGAYKAHLLPQIAEFFMASHLRLGRVEFRAAPGENALAQAVGNNVERVHTITPAEMRKYVMSDAVQRYLRAVRERGFRSLWVRFNLPDADSEDFSLIDEAIGTNFELISWNKELLHRLVDELQAAGYHLGQPDSLPCWSNGWFGIIGAALGAALSVLLLLLLAGAPGFLVVLGTMGTMAGSIVLALLGRPILARQAIAFVAANGYASLAITLPFALNYPSAGSADKSLASCLTGVRSAKIAFFLAVLTALFGGLVITTALGDYRFMLKTHQYLGVKASFLLPLVWVAVFVFGWDPKLRALSWSAFRTNVNSSLQPAKTWWQRMLWAAAALFVLGVYLARSANFVLPVSDLELAMRAMFEQTLIARPRAKEFLIGHPLLLLGLDRLFVLRRFYRLLLVMGGIGAVSITNTFCHVHTPIAMSLLRTLYGALLGGFGGLVLICCGKLFDRLFGAGYERGVEA